MAAVEGRGDSRRRRLVRGGAQTVPGIMGHCWIPALTKMEGLGWPVTGPERNREIWNFPSPAFDKK